MNEHEQLAYEAGCTIGSVGLKAEITRLRAELEREMDAAADMAERASTESARLRAALDAQKAEQKYLMGLAAADAETLRSHIDDIVPKWAAARDEVDRLRAESLEANLKLDEFQRRIWKAEADLAVMRGELVEARYWWGAIRTEKEDIRTRAERAEVDLATITSQRDTALGTIAVWRSVIYALQAELTAAREVMTKVADLIDSEADDPLQDAINMALVFLERTTAAPAAPLSPTPPK